MKRKWHLFCIETKKKLLDNLDIDYKEISLGGKWIPGLIRQGDAPEESRSFKNDRTVAPAQYIDWGKSIGSLFSGLLGLVPTLLGV